MKDKCFDVIAYDLVVCILITVACIAFASILSGLPRYILGLGAFIGIVLTVLNILALFGCNWEE